MADEARPVPAGVRRWGGLAVVLLWAALVAAGFWGFSYDDAFITYRYARSWQEDGALRFNPGESVYGTTAPGYALLLGSLAKITPGIGVPEWGTLLSVLSLAALAALLAAGLAAGPVEARAGPTEEGGAEGGEGPTASLVTAFAPVLFGLLLLGLRWNVELLGAETFPALALVGLGAWLLFGRSREGTGGLLLAAAAIVRLDAGLAACALGCAYWARRRRFPWRLAVAGVVPLALYLGLLLALFGRVAPPTLGVKQSELAASGQASYSAAEWQWLLRSIGLPGALVLLALAVTGVVWLTRSGLLGRLPVRALAGWIAAHELFYRLVGVPFAPWYAVYTVAAVTALAALGAVAAAGWTTGFLAARLAAARVGTATGAGGRGSTAGAAVLAVLLLAPVLAPSGAWLGRQWGEPPDPRWDLYHRVGKWLAERSAPGDTVASVEVGFLGYTSRRPVLDLLGLVSPGVLEARRRGRLPALVSERAPRYLLDVPWLRPLGLGDVLAHPSVAEAYLPVAVFPVEGGEAVRLLERR